MADRDKQEWQAEQEALNAAMDKQREKERKTRERSARNAQRKLERLRRTLREAGELSDWEDEFSGSVTQRLDKYGSAFHDLQKSRPGDALSFAQKRVVAALNKKAKDQRKAARLKRQGGEELPDADADSPSKYPSKNKRSSSGFKSKRKKAFTPRVRQIDEDFSDEIIDEPAVHPKSSEPYIPDFSERPKVQKPFLRIVKTDS